MPDQQALIEIKSSRLRAAINPLGAELSVLRDAEDRDLLWGGDPRVWAGRAPILFPIVGMLNEGRYRLNGRSFALPKHGFARHALFEVIQTTEATASFRLRSSPATLAVYPFAFELDIQFSVEDARLTLSAAVTNLDPQEPMPASIGFHPALRWPLPFGRPRADHAITFDQIEPDPIRRIDAEGLLTPDAFPTPVEGDELLLQDELFIDDALIFDRIKSRRLRYGAGAGPFLEIEFPDAECLGIWTKPGADFICIEPWRGRADPEGFTGDIWAKPGIVRVAPLGVWRFEMSIALP